MLAIGTQALSYALKFNLNTLNELNLSSHLTLLGIPNVKLLSMDGTNTKLAI